jgi:hypothetical protein
MIARSLWSDPPRGSTKLTPLKWPLRNSVSASRSGGVVSAGARGSRVPHRRGEISIKTAIAVRLRVIGNM